MKKQKKPTITAVLKEALEHPELVRKFGISIAEQLALDHISKPKTTTKQGKRVYQRNLMRIRRFKQANKKLDGGDVGLVWSAVFGKQKEKKRK